MTTEVVVNGEQVTGWRKWFLLAVGAAVISPVVVAMSLMLAGVAVALIPILVGVAILGAVGAVLAWIAPIFATKNGIRRGD